jgi:hypothetical protein
MGRPRRYPQPGHTEAAARLRAAAGEWQEVSTYRSRQSADSVAHRIRTAYRLPAYEPAGAFVARVEMREDGWAVVGCWPGAEAEADAEWAAALASVRAGGDQ